MPLTDPQKVDAYFGAEPGVAGAPGLPPILGVGLLATPSAATAVIGTAGVYVPVPGTWSGIGTAWTLTAAGLLTYDPTPLQPTICTVMANGGFLPVAAALREIRIRLSINGAEPESIGGGRVALDSSIEDHRFIGVLRRLKVQPGDTLQLMITNATEADDVLCQKVRVSIAAG